MRIDAVRVARSTDRLDEVVRFYRDLVGLAVIGGFEDHDGYTGVMLGLPGEGVHLEFTTHRDGSPASVTGDDDLLVLYLDDDSLDGLLSRLDEAVVARLHPANPYWVTIGAVCVADPDGRRLVLVPSQPLA